MEQTRAMTTTYVFLRNWQGVVDSLPQTFLAGTNIDDDNYDVVAIQAGGAALIVNDGGAVETIRAQFVQMPNHVYSDLTPYLYAAGAVSSIPASGVVTADIAANAVTAAKMATAVTTKIMGTPTLAVGAESANHIDVTVTLKDIAGTTLAAVAPATVWVSDTAGAAPSATAPDGGTSVQTGTQLKAVTAGVLLDVLSSSAGVIVVRLTESTAKTYFVNVAVGGLIASSAAVTFA
jgi:hypothetical protein